jgi:uncharacterized protein (DUF697 family)
MGNDANSGKKFQRSRKRGHQDVAEVAQFTEVDAVEPAPAQTDSGETEAVPPMESVAVEVVEPFNIASFDQEAKRDAQGMAIVKHYMKWSAGAGVVPVPMLDMMTMLAVQMTMVHKLADLYDVPYTKNRIKAAVAGLISGVNAGYLGGSALKMFPVFGVLTLAAMPALNAAITYAVGKVFIQHFASGGTFLDFDPSSVRTYFNSQLREGKAS